MRKRGQFYIVSAIVIILVIVGFATVSNLVQEKPSVRLFDLKDELGIESGKVLDHGTYQNLDENAKDDLISNFTELYIDFAGEGRNLYFVFGDFSEVFVITYEEVTRGEISIEGIGSSGRTTVETFQRGITKQSYVPQGNQVQITIGEDSYDFELKPGENFYFVVSEQIGEEQVVIVS